MNEQYAIWNVAQLVSESLISGTCNI